MDDDVPRRFGRGGDPKAGLTRCGGSDPGAERLAEIDRRHRENIVPSRTTVKNQIIAAAAAEKASDGDLARLREHAERTLRATDWQMYEVADNVFHTGIARSTGNPLAIAFLGVLSAVRSRVRWQREHDLTFRRDRGKEYTEQQGRMHAAILDAIEARDSEGARRAMEAHLRAVRKVMVVD